MIQLNHQEREAPSRTGANPASAGWGLLKFDSLRAQNKNKIIGEKHNGKENHAHG